jgi:hypothetical protein
VPTPVPALRWPAVVPNTMTLFPHIPSLKNSALEEIFSLLLQNFIFRVLLQATVVQRIYLNSDLHIMPGCLLFISFVKAKGKGKGVPVL